MPGSGKSTWAFNYIEDNRASPWIYVSPYLDEVGDGGKKGRIQKRLSDMSFISPNSGRTSKTKHLEKLLNSGENVAITHNLFNRMNTQMLGNIKFHGYRIIIDEVLESMSIFNPKDMSYEDIKYLLADEYLIRMDTGQLLWNPEKHCLSPLLELKELCDRGELYVHGQVILIKKSNVKALTSAIETVVMTYRFESSLMSYWLRLFDQSWTYIQPYLFKTDEELKDELRNNLSVMSIPNPMKTLAHSYSYPPGAFSASFYKKASQSDLDRVKKSIENSVRMGNRFLYKQGIKHGVFWTTFADYKDRLTGRGYTQQTMDDATIPFASKNIKASNDYRNKNICVYTVNVYMHKHIYQYLSECFGKDFVDDEGYALSEMIQFVYRGAIRDNKPMVLYVFSERMYRLFTNWLYDINGCKTYV